MRARERGNLKSLIGENAETVLLHFALQLEGLLDQGILNECESYMECSGYCFKVYRILLQAFWWVLKLVDHDTSKATLDVL